MWAITTETPREEEMGRSYSSRDVSFDHCANHRRHIMSNVAGEEMSSPGTIGNSTLHDTMEALLPVCVAIYIIYGSLLAVVVVLHVLWVRYLPCNTYDVLV